MKDEYFPFIISIISFSHIDCTDRMKCCKELATNGLCRNVPFVRENCKYSCNTGQCRVQITQKPITTTPTTTTTTIQPTSTKTACVDQYSACGSWTVSNRHCRKADGCCSGSKYTSYMTKHCRKSCGFCWSPCNYIRTLIMFIVYTFLKTN